MVTVAAPVLGPLRDRLGCDLPGVLGAGRPDPRRDADALARRAFWDTLNPLDDVARESPLSPAAVASHLTAAADVLRTDREVLLALLLSPAKLLARVDELARGRSADQTWAWLCFVSEAAWRTLGTTPAGDSYAVGDTGVLMPIATRLRFLVLTEPFRQPSGEAADRISSGFPATVFGANTPHVFVGRAREARQVWVGCLDEYQSHPLLAEADSGILESELDQTLFRCPRPASRGGWVLGEPLRISDKATTDARAPLTATDAAVVTEVMERHLLPRFRLLRVSRLACATPYRYSSGWATGATLLTAVVAITLAALGWFGPAAWAGVATFVLIGTGVVGFGQRWAAQWLLRLPAAGAVGLVLLTALAPTWWQHPTPRWQTTLVLVGASLGYLVVVARNHGVAPWPALRRSASVTLVGCGHAFLVALVGLVLVAPSYAEEATTNDGGHTMLALWRDPALAGEAWSVLGLATAWCMAVGVFSQILWDDRPITAALAHLQWRRGRRR